MVLDSCGPFLESPETFSGPKSHFRKWHRSVSISLGWSVYHLSTKTENSGWKFKWYSSFLWKVSGNDGNPQTYSSLPVPTGITGKILYHLWTPTRPGSLRPLFPPFDIADTAAILICHCFLLAARDSGLAKHHTGKILYHYERSIPTGFSVQMVNAPGLCSRFQDDKQQNDCEVWWLKLSHFSR